MKQIVAELVAVATKGKHYYRFDVLFDGKRVVESSVDPESDLARVLLDRGIREVQVYCGDKHHSTVNTKKAAKRLCIDGDKKLYTTKYRDNPFVSDKGA